MANEKYCNEINIDTAEHERIVVCNGLATNTHVVTTSTIYDDERDEYLTTMTVYHQRSGQVAVDVKRQAPEQSYYHEIFAPMYRSLCHKVGVNPKIVE